MSSFFSLFVDKKYLYKKRIPKKIDDKWKVYIPAAKKIVIELIEEINTNNTFLFNRITIRNQKTRWGSCSSKKNLNFNYKIVKLPKNLAKYLVIHELCHLKHMNHSKDYWELVKIYCPDYKNLRKELLLKSSLI